MSISAYDPQTGYKSASCSSTIKTKFDADGNTVESRSSTMGETYLSFNCNGLVPANSTIHWSWFYCGSVSVSGIYTTGTLWLNNTVISTSGGELDLNKALSATVGLWFKAKDSVAGGPYTPTYSQTATFNNCYMEVFYTPPGKCSTPTSVTVSPTSTGPGGSATLSWGASSGGHNNAVAGYYVSIYNYQTGVESELGRTNASTRSYAVTAPSGNGQKYKYRVYALPTLAGYASDWSGWSADLVCNFSAPSVSDVTLDNSSSAIYVVAGCNVTLRWIGANGTNNAITSYNIYQNGVIYKTGQGGSSLVVPSHSSSGSSYYYTVLPIAPHGNGAGVNSPSVYSYVACGMPTAVSVNANNVPPSTNYTLSWSGATAGGQYNAISSYQIHRSTSPTSGYTHVWNTTATSYTVASHASNGSAYYYKVLTVGTRLASGLSTAYGTLVTHWTNPNATGLALSSQYSVPSGYVTFSWNPVQGTNNAISAYYIYQNGVHYTTVYSPSVSVIANGSAGASIQYSLVVAAPHGNSATLNAPVLYSYGPVNAPTAVSVSPTVVDAGTNATLSWSGASGVSYNTITGYSIYRAVGTGGWAWLADVNTTATYGSLAVSANTSMGVVHYYSVYTLGSRQYSAQSTVNANLTAQTYSTVKAPTAISVSPTTVYSGDTATLTWSGADHGTNNPITAYKIWYRKVSGGDLTFLKEVASTAKSGTTSVISNTTLGGTYDYYVETVGTKAGFLYANSTVYAVLSTYAYEACKAPTTVKVSASLINPGVNGTISWSGATGGTNVNIAGYDIYKAVGTGGYAIYDSVLSSVSSVTDNVPESGGIQYYKIKTLGDVAGYDSGFSSVVSMKGNTPPTAPTSVTASPTLYEGGSISIKFPACSDVDNNLSHYQIQRRIQTIANGWGSWTNLDTNFTALSITDAPTIERGMKVQYQVKSHDLLGLYSGYTQSIQVIRNSVPLAPVEGYPVNDKNTYNSNPYFRVYVPPEPDGTGQTLQMAIDAGEYSNVSNVPSGGSNIRTRAGGSLGNGPHTIKFRTVDITGGVGPALTLTISILPVDYARDLTIGKVIAKRGSHFAEDIFVSAEGVYNEQKAEFMAGHSFLDDVFEITGNAGISHQTEILQLYQQVNNVRAYYGLPPISIPELVGDHVNPGEGRIGMFAAWGGQMMDIRNALAETWPINGISAMTWIACTNGMYPLASVINQIRDRIQAG